MTRSELESESGGPWSRFARAFAARASSRWSWRALLVCVGLAVFAPLLANDRPYFARVRDSIGYREAKVLLVPIAEALIQHAKTVAATPGGPQAELDAEERAFAMRIATLERTLAGDGNARRLAGLAELAEGSNALTRAARERDSVHCETLGAELAARARTVRELVEVQGPLETALAPERAFPLFAALSWSDVTLMCGFLGLAGFRFWKRLLPRRGIRAQLGVLACAAFVLGTLTHAIPRTYSETDSGHWKTLIAADVHSVFVFPPIAFGPSEQHFGLANAPPTLASRHWCGTDAVGRDLLARMLYAGRTSFAAATLAAFLIVSLGSLLGLAAGGLRGGIDVFVSRAIDALQSLPTLVLLLGIVALLPPSAGNSRWTIPLVIAAVGWTHVARLARAEALRVSELPFVHAATAAGFSRPRVLFRHVLPNSMGPVWIVACFVLSAGLVLESSAAFLGFGVQLPAPSFGGLIAEANQGGWWLALFPGLWLFTAIVAIHLVGEGVRDALDPRAEGARA